MESYLILDALRFHRERRRSFGILTDNIDGEIDPDSPLVSHFTGQQIATRFADTASELLSLDEATALVTFFREGQSSTNVEQLNREIRERFHAFQEEETILSGWDRGGFVEPSGPEDADLTLVLHIRTGRPKDPHHDFWQDNCYTMRLLNDKGLSASFVYGFDIHWRPENERSKSMCSTRTWPDGVSQLHNELSLWLLQKLPSRFVLVGGSCPRKLVRDYYKAHDPSLHIRTIRIPLEPAQGLFTEVDLIYQHRYHKQQALQRLIVYLPHPSTAAQEGRNEIPSASLQIDSAINLVLWLLNKPCHESVAQQRSVQSKLAGSNLLPWIEVARLRRMEETRGSMLSPAELPVAFRRWARNYLGESFEILAQEGKSIINACNIKLAAKAVKSRYDNLDITHKSPNRKRLHDTAYQDPRKVARLNSRDTGLAIQKPEFELSQEEIQNMQKSINRDAALKRHGGKSKSIWHGSSVKVLSGGRIKLRLPWSDVALTIHLPVESRIQQNPTPTIHFSSDRIEIKRGNNVICTRRTKNLYGTVHGDKWRRLISEEMQAQQFATSESSLSLTLIPSPTQPRQGQQHLQRARSPEFKKNRGSFGIGNSYGKSSRGKYNAERRQKLLGGTRQRCVQRPKSSWGTVILREQTTIKIPLVADFDNIWVQCELLSGRHPNMCGPEELVSKDDPAQRLGICYRYTHCELQTQHEEWVKVDTDWQVQQMNSLVDYLEGRDLQFSKNQPRRVIAKRDGKDSHPAYSTSGAMARNQKQ